MLFGRLKRAAGFLGLSFLPAVVCGPLLGYGWHIGVHPELSNREADTARRLVLEAMESEADARGLQLSFALVLDDEPEMKALLRERRYLQCRNVPVAVLDLQWESFEDYLAHLPWKKRGEFRRQIRRNRQAGTTVHLMESSAGLENRLQELIDANSLKHNSIPFALGNGFFGELQRNLGRHVRIFTARKSGDLTAVCVLLERNDAAFAIAVGVDAAAAGDDCTYFQIGYYSLIADAMGSGMRRMFYGRGMYDIKVRRGCRLVDSWIYSRATGRGRILSAAWFAVVSFWNRRKRS